MHQRTISSKVTFFCKFLFPLLFIPSFTSGILSLVFDSTRTSDVPKMFILLFLLGIIFFIYWYCIRIKKVTIWEDKLLISNYIKEIEIKISEVNKVTENVWMSLHPVTIHLRNSTEFGNKIVFIPTVRPFAFLSSHPIVSELKKMIDENNYKFTL